MPTGTTVTWWLRPCSMATPWSMPTAVRAADASSTREAGQITATLPLPIAAISSRTAWAMAGPSSPGSSTRTNCGGRPSWRTERGGRRSGAERARTRAARSMFGPGMR